MIIEWLTPVLEWTGLTMIQLLLLAIVLILIFKD